MHLVDNKIGDRPVRTNINRIVFWLLGFTVFFIIAATAWWLLARQ